VSRVPVLVAGTLVLLLDAFLVAVLHDLLFVRTRRLPLALRTTAALLTGLSSDSVVFGVLAFHGSGTLGRVLAGQLAGKAVTALVPGPALALRLSLRRFTLGDPSWARELREAFSILSYRRR
jgi:uncharacterized PurR-regulated membrane protein YhhQ (DUF165 family)